MTRIGLSASPLDSIKNELKNVYKFRFVTYAYVSTNIKLRYRRSYLGFLWTVLAPMTHYLIMGFVFTMLMGRNRAGYFEYYFTGALFFSLISGILNRSITTFLINEHFIKKIYVPKLTFIVNSVGIELTNFVLSGSALVFLGVIFGRIHFTPVCLLAIIPVILGAFALAGLSCLISLATVYFRDFTNIIPAVVQAMFFATPVIYDQSMIPEQYKALIYYNPLYYILELFRNPLLSNTIPPIEYYIFAALFSLVCFVTGILVLLKFDNRIVFKL